MRIKFLLLVSAMLFCTVTHAEDSPETVCKSAAELFADGDVEGALEEARWCVSLLEQVQQQNISKHFSDEINGFTGLDLSQQNAMGFMVIERQYEKGNQFVDVMLNAGASGGAMQAFSALAQFGMQSGNGRKMRIQKRTALASSEGGQANVTITLKSGGMLVFESDTVSLDDLTAFAKAFPVSDLDEAMN